MKNINIICSQYKQCLTFEEYMDVGLFDLSRSVTLNSAGVFPMEGNL